MKKVIESYYGDVREPGENRIDGIYIVEIPDEHADDYKGIICEVSDVLRKIESEEVETPDELDTEYLPFEFYDDVWEKMRELPVSNLSNILNLLRWKWKAVVIDESYDADYGEFD